MLARTQVAAALLLPLALAGCAGGGGGNGETSTTAAGSGGAVHVHGLMPPVLQVGDWWNFTTPTGALSYVVSADNGDDYTMDTDNAGLAFFDALSDVSTLGAVRKSDLAGSQGDTRVQFLQWPLVDGKNWTTTWDGLPVSVVARVSGEVATMTAKRADGTLYATYTYSNRTRWFTGLTFMDGQGAPAFELKLQASGTGFAHPLVRYKLAHVAEDAVAGPAVGLNTNFQVPAGATDVYLAYSTECNPGAFFLSMGPLSQDAQSQGSIADGPCDGPHTTAVPASPGGGNWGIAFQCTAPTNCAITYQLLVRTLTSFAPGKAPA